EVPSLHSLLRCSCGPKGEVAAEDDLTYWYQLCQRCKLHRARALREIIVESLQLMHRSVCRGTHVVMHVNSKWLIGRANALTPQSHRSCKQAKCRTCRLDGDGLACGTNGSCVMDANSYSIPAAPASRTILPRRIASDAT